MKKKDKRFKSFIVPILNTEYKVYVYIGDKVRANKEICKYIEEKGEFIEDSNRGKTVFRRGYHPCIWIDGTLDHRTGTATIAHEAIHAVAHIMNYLGMDVRDNTGDELLAHSVAAVLKKVLPL